MVSLRRFIMRWRPETAAVSTKMGLVVSPIVVFSWDGPPYCDSVDCLASFRWTARLDVNKSGGDMLSGFGQLAPGEVDERTGSKPK